MLELRHVSAGYRGNIILKDIDLSLEPGRITVLLGPNGSGKSTLLHTLTGQLPPISGDVMLDGTPFSALSRRDIARHVAFLAQDRTVPQMTARRLVLHGRFPYISYPRSYSKEDRRIADEALRTAGAIGYADSPIGELSGGQRQSVYLAMVLAQQTENVLMDEPTSWLDISHQFALFDTARRLADDGKAVLMVLHDIAQALRVADTVLMPDGNGGITPPMTPKALFETKRLDAVFGIRLIRAETEDGTQYLVLPPKKA